MSCILRPIRGLQLFRNISEVNRRPLACIAALSGEGPLDGDGSTVKCSFTKVKGKNVDFLTEVLVGYGAEAVMVDGADEGDQPGQEIFAESEQKLWGLCNMTAHFHCQDDAKAAVHQIKREFPTIQVETQPAPVSNNDWVQSVKDSYKPQQVVPGLWVIPTWSQPPDPQATNIMLHPGLAFGTGDHATTQMCLQALMDADLHGKDVIDYGTGSGILALAALSFGANHVVGVDADPIAVVASAQNAELNKMEDKFMAVRCGHTSEDAEPLAEAGQGDRQFDVCIANILMGPLLDLRDRLSGYVKPGGCIIISGILVEQVDAIQTAYATHFVDLDVRFKEGWAAVVGKKGETKN